MSAEGLLPKPDAKEELQRRFPVGSWVVQTGEYHRRCAVVMNHGGNAKNAHLIVDSGDPSYNIAFEAGTELDPYGGTPPLTPTIEMLTAVTAALIGNPQVIEMAKRTSAVFSPGATAARVAWAACEEHNRLTALHHAEGAMPDAR